MQSGSWIDIYRVFRKVSLFSYPEVGICKRKNLRKKERKHAFDQEKKANFKIFFLFFKFPHQHSTAIGQPIGVDYTLANYHRK